MSIRDPVPGRRSSRSIFFAVITKRAAAMPTIAVPRTISASPAMLPNFGPGNDKVRPAEDGAASSRNRSNFSTRNPKAITAMAVRTQARNVRSFAEWSLKFLIILSDNMNPRNGTINIKRIGAQWDKVLRLAKDDSQPRVCFWIITTHMDRLPAWQDNVYAEGVLADV